MKKLLIFTLGMFLIAGCQPAAQPPRQEPNRPQVQSVTPTTNYVKVEKTEFQSPSKVIINAKTITETEALNATDESVIELKDTDGIINFATAAYSDQDVKTVDVLEQGKLKTSVTVPTEAVIESNTNQNASILGTPGTVQIAGIRIPPPGTRLDRTISPVAGVNASRSQKVAALRQVGESQLGVKYVWGASKDRGGNGFDCSNYTAYVYRHALGYKFSGASKTQYTSVGVRVAVASMQPGDLVTFDKGAHVGIYMGNGRMIQEGGGAGKCAYLPLKKGSYWYNHISAVKRMF